MFKSARWRSEKNKVKVVFKLQFHAAKIVDDALMISVVPADAGKPAVKSDKAVVRDGSCFWENPVYETVKFNREPKSGKIHERIYYFVVVTGSSKAGVIGEASIDFSHYVDATKVSLVSLPIKCSKTEAILHVSIQRMQESVDHREVEESENAKSNYKDHSLKAQLSNGDMDESIKSNSDDVPFNKTVSHVAELNGTRWASSGSDITMSSSESSSGVEMQINTALEISTDDSLSTPREAFLGQRLEEPLDVVIEKLKSEVAALSRQAEMSELELQTLRKQIVKESKRGQDLFKELVCLKEERDGLKGECEKLKAAQRRVVEAKARTNVQFEGGDSRELVEELRQELNHAKELNANLQIQLQKTQESNSELILAVRDLDEMLEQKNKEITNLSSGLSANDDIDERAREAGPTRRPDDDNDDEEQKALEELVKEHGDAKEAYLLEQQIINMRNEIEIYKRDKDELEMQMEQLALDYEIMKQENHEMAYKLEQSELQEQLKLQYECSSSYTATQELENQIENLENELKRRSKESADALVTISELEAHVKSLEEELEKQSQGFEADLEALMRSKVEQEQRAIRAEETLRKTRRQNANTAERLQEEFKRLSVQMVSTFESNEKLATKALAEANELRLQKSNLEEMIRKASEEHRSIKSHYEVRLRQMMNKMEKMQSEIEDRALELENQKKHAEETRGLLSDEISKLQDEIETSMAKNKILSEEMGNKETLMNELEQLRISIKEMELLVKQGDDERIELEKKIMSVKCDAEESQKELNSMRCILEEKELIVEKMQSKLDSLQSQYTELKRTLSEDAVEKDELRKQVILLKCDLKKWEDDMETTSNTSVLVPQGSKEVSNLTERIKLLEDQIMLKESALETSNNAFLEKEKELHDEIGELEERLEVLNQSTIHFCENEVEKVTTLAEDQDPNFRSSEETRKHDEDSTNPKTRAAISLSSNDTNSPETPKRSADKTGNLDELTNEMTLLKERNELMEAELKEMQERYSEISVKFAEVEGERQQLVMRVRNLKNTKKRT
ncbi:hypothetical protein DH2020_028757 [Rehmannia glutinosa]|uniref:C2 NT-type domain-containing protein n=1 Tax=Rehmannia glutinosa TaxID=99300 RepID=A0ABR0VTT7_REHGL